MNRLVPAHARLTVCVATLWLLAVSDASSQTSAPSPLGTMASSMPGGPVPTLATAQQAVAQVRAAIGSQDYHTAVQGFRSVAGMTAQFPQLAGDVQSLRSTLEGIGIDGALLSMPPRPAVVTRLPEVADALPINSAANPKQEALRLVAIGRAALDRGDVSNALQMARQAEAMNVPEQQFAPGEPRPWQLVLDAESAARRQGMNVGGVVQASSQTPVKSAGGVNPTANPVAQMLFTADADAAGAASNIQQVQATETLPPANHQYAYEMYNKGLAALGQGDKSKAREHFLEAWKHEADLAPAERNQLKDKLTLLQPTRLAPKPQGSQGELTPIQKADLEAQENTRRLYREVTSELAKAEQEKAAAPLDALDQLERLRRRVDTADLDDKAKRSLAVMVDRAIAEQNKFIDANRAKINLDLQNDSVRTEMDQDRERTARIDQEVSSMVDTYNDLMKERRYQEAEIVAKQVSELKPGDPIAIQMHHNSRMGTRIAMHQEVADERELNWIDTMNDIDRSMIGPNPNNPMSLPDAPTWESLSRRRLHNQGDSDPRLSAAENAIKKKLSTPVNIKYRDRPLGEVLDDLKAVTGIPIVIDERALSAVRVTPETPVTLQLPDSIPLKSALNIILERIELTYVIENDVLTITNMDAKRSKVYPRTYRVTDLVTPIPNFTSSYDDGLAGALRAAYQMSSPQADVHVMPVSMTDLGTGMANQMSPMSMNPNVMGQYHSMGNSGGFGPSNPPTAGGGGGSSFADFDSLIQLIQTTVAPDTWEALGGPSTMAPYPQNLSLIISTTSEVHDQIVDLLDSLRKLQNLQITIEVRFITLSDTFAEQIGVDFQVQFDDNTQALPDDDSGPSVTVGFDGIGGTVEPDLDIHLRNGSFGVTPAFGSANLGNPSSIGFAILSDIEAFFFLQAAQADTRTNVMQSPKVTLFDGQLASISDVTQRPFVTSITPVVGDFAVAQQPVIVVLNEGTQLNVQGIVSDDKRFVRLTLVPFFSQIGDVTTFTYEGRRSTRQSSRNEEDTNGDGIVDENDATDTTDDEDITEGTTVQLPTFAFTSVSTTVSVPDGGTILLGGIKRLAENRSERGIPVLSKIPYVSRLFRNVAVGRDARSLMLMVTPRIIIQEEEELAQTGFDPSRQ